MKVLVDTVTAAVNRPDTIPDEGKLILIQNITIYSTGPRMTALYDWER